MLARRGISAKAQALPLALLDLPAKIATAQSRHPERLGHLYRRYRSLMKQIREEKELSMEELSALSGSSEDFLQAAEAANLEMTDDSLKTLHEVYWELATGEDNPGDFKRLANQRLATPPAGPRNFMTAAARRFSWKTWRGDSVLISDCPERLRSKIRETKPCRETKAS
jgi:hypothetical protein